MKMRLILGLIISLIGGFSSLSATYRPAGGVILSIIVETNPATGYQAVLPIGIKYCDDVTSNPLWSAPVAFGPKTKMVSRIDISVPTNYNSGLPFYVESFNTTNQIWETNFIFYLYETSTEMIGCGPCQILNTDNHMGIIEASLFDVDANSYSDTESTYGSTTNSIMGRFGLGACNTKIDDYFSRSSVAFIYFNLPPRGYIEDRYCQPATNFLQYPYNTNWCGYDTNWLAGFVMCLPNRDNYQNWPHYPYPCKVDGIMKTYRVRYAGYQPSDPEIFPSVISNYFGLTFNTDNGCTYRIFYKNTMNATNWQTFTTIRGYGGQITIFDHMTSPSRFYELKCTNWPFFPHP